MIQFNMPWEFGFPLILFWFSLWISFISCVSQSMSSTTTLHSFNITGYTSLSKTKKSSSSSDSLSVCSVAATYLLIFLIIVLTLFLISWSSASVGLFFFIATCLTSANLLASLCNLSVFFLYCHKLYVLSLYKFLMDFLLCKVFSRPFLAFFFHFRSCISWCWL